jgi:4a-hydroxytetrahydrobiopterin dehydratase
MQGSEQALEASIMRSSKQTLTEEEISHLVHELPEWAVEDGQLVRFWTFPDFVQAVAFVNRVAKVAEAAGHHPDIDIRYNRVRLALVSHDAGGITARDANMARQLSDGPTTAKNPAKKSKAAK